jgi:hypothetical protein
MDFIMTIFSLVVLITVVFSFIMIIKLTVIQHGLKFKQKQYIKEKFPELTKRDLAYRQIKIVNYQQLYLNSSFKYKLQMTSIIASVIMTIGVLFVGYFTNNAFISFLLLSLVFGLISIYLLTQPSLEERSHFWKKYLEEHPDNPMKVTLMPAEFAEKAYNNEKKLDTYVLFFAVSLFVFSFYLN